MGSNSSTTERIRASERLRESKRGSGSGIFRHHFRNTSQNGAARFRNDRQHILISQNWRHHDVVVENKSDTVLAKGIEGGDGVRLSSTWSESCVRPGEQPVGTVSRDRESINKDDLYNRIRYLFDLRRDELGGCIRGHQCIRMHDKHTAEKSQGSSA